MLAFFLLRASSMPGQQIQRRKNVVHIWKQNPAQTLTTSYLLVCRQTLDVFTLAFQFRSGLGILQNPCLILPIFCFISQSIHGRQKTAFHLSKSRMEDKLQVCTYFPTAANACIPQGNTLETLLRHITCSYKVFPSTDPCWAELLSRGHTVFVNCGTISSHPAPRSLGMLAPSSLAVCFCCFPRSVLRHC